MEPSKPAVILLFGPTGVGKTALLDRLFTRREAEIISADSLQIYRGMDIGTAKPDAGILSRLPHHLIDILDYTQPFSVAEFVRRANDAVRDILERGKLPVISGGTAYYLKAWLLGLPETPEVDPRIRKELAEFWKDADNAAMKEAVRTIDPVSADRLGEGDRYRMLRVLEVYRQTQRPLSDFPVPDTPRKDYRVLSVGLSRERSQLYSRIDMRVDQMFEEGLAQEVAGLRAAGARKTDPGMKGIGYQEWFFDSSGEPDSETESHSAEVKKLIARNSRRYAKRQITFFSSLPEVRWFDVSDQNDVPDGLEAEISLITASG